MRSCGVNRTWRRLGQSLFFTQPWQVPHLICHPTQLFCLVSIGSGWGRVGEHAVGC